MVKFLDLEAINKSFEPQLSQALRRVMDSGWYLLGKEVTAFEKAFSQYIGCTHTVAVGSGLDALKLIFLAYIQIGAMRTGDEIIVPANTCIATFLAISSSGLIPVPVEPEMLSYNIDPLEIERKISKKTRAIMIVHLYGQVAMHEHIAGLIGKYGLILIEDNAQAVGGLYGDIRTGAIGHAAAHSFYPSKNLGAMGDGGAVTTNDHLLADTIRTLANYGSIQKNVNRYQGINSRLDELQAAVLRVKLARLDEDNKKRGIIAKSYIHNIKNMHIILPKVSVYGMSMLGHVWHLFVIRSEERDRLQSYLYSHDIQTQIHYPIPPHKQEAYKQMNHLNFPKTEVIHNEVLSLPISPLISQEDVFKVIETINRF
ncbi:DegT/DnrJ/EryC1/StrS family aminotransferase [Anditalea andensis]|uniref:Aminotransferase n=1 Tax=Anditalea andensis TaxID=1048983 RepID=A0A074KRI4_9BACT|nr:DegT/DnrJ/EryC1/StrS family aminotransferase [Anditalea andensis]KEO72551.1 aminotransferase [Anditalea andensis]